MDRATAGVGRQCTGTAGRIENAIFAVYATYATAHGHALVDRDLYVQSEWFTDPERMRRAGLDDGHAFATKGRIARDQARRVLDAGLEPAWATGDEARLDPAVTRPARGSARAKSGAVRTGPVARASVSAHAQKPALRPPLPRRTPKHLAVRGRVPSPARP